MSMFRVMTNEEGYVVAYRWTDQNLDGWKPTVYGGDYVADGSLYFKKLVNGELLLDELKYKEYLEAEANKEPEEPEPTQLDIIQANTDYLVMMSE